MSSQMTIEGREAPVGLFVMTFRRFGDERPPCSWVDLMPEHEDDSLAGIALNCIDVGNVESVNALHGREFSFGEESRAEIRESVLWGPNRQMLEIESLRIKFGPVTGEQISFELQADCFDHFGRTDIPVVVSGSARLISKMTLDIACPLRWTSGSLRNPWLLLPHVLRTQSVQRTVNITAGSLGCGVSVLT